MEKHDLIHEFPDLKNKIHELKTSNHHFRKLFDAYHEVDHSIRSIETGATPTTNEHLNDLRSKRVYLKDELYTYLKN